MRKIEIYDPPLCCATGVCGPDPDQRLIRFAADLRWLSARGVMVRRYNLAQEPLAFTAQAAVQRIVTETGGDFLPIIVVDGQVVSRDEFPSRRRLAELAGLSADDMAIDDEAAAQGSPGESRIASLVTLEGADVRLKSARRDEPGGHDVTAASETERE